MNSMSHSGQHMNMTHMGMDLSQTGSGISGTNTDVSGMGSDVANDSTGMCSGAGNSSMDGMMKMYFHTGIMEYILFQQFQTQSATGFAWACFVIFVVAFLYELLKYFREELLRQHLDVRMTQHTTILASNEEEQSLLMKPRLKLWSRGHLVQTALHFVQLWLSYCLMLIFMTYNVYLCLSLVLGATLGYFLTGWKRGQVQDPSQHCG